MSHLVFLLEERSAKAMLEVFVPRIVPAGTDVRYFPFEGKQDLEKNLERKLKGYLVPGARFLILRDQDSANCQETKHRLAALCSNAGCSDAVVRIACKELESWYLSDLHAVSRAYDKPSLVRQAGKARYRNPDGMVAPSRELSRLVPEYQKIDGSRRIGAHLDPDNQRSRSFHNFVSAVRRLAGEPAAS